MDRSSRELERHGYNQQYFDCSGDAELRDQVLEYYRDVLPVDKCSHDVIIAPGSKLLLYALQMAIDGDIVIPTPSWVSYRAQVCKRI